MKLSEKPTEYTHKHTQIKWELNKRRLTNIITIDLMNINA